MKHFGLSFAAAFTAAIFSLPLCSQTGSSADAKHFLTSLPHGEGRLTFVADSIEREWTPAVVHLKGNVRVEIWASPKNRRSMTVLRADEVDYNETTGKFSPHGNVSLTVEEAKQVTRETVVPPSRDAMDALVVKIQARTGRLAWATRTGGSFWDAAGDLTVARDGSIYVLGSTRSADFPTTSDAVQRRFGGPDRDVFLLKLDSSGKIIYSTLLGGSKSDEATGLSVTEDGTVFVGGVTRSADFPGLRLAEFGPRGQQDAFVARLRPGDWLSAMQRSTLLVSPHPRT